MPTINDVSKLAGVSKATVSRVINNKGQIKDATRKVVFEAMQTLNYKPNTLAQALATKTSNNIGLITSIFDGNYFGVLLKESAKLADQAGKQLIVTDGHNDPQREIEAIDSLVARRCDVILLYSRKLTQQDFKNIKARTTTPIVIMNREVKDNTYHSVWFDHYHASALAINHLLELGHTAIACITASVSSDTVRLRYQAFQDCLEQQKLTINHKIISAGDYTTEGGYHACKNIIAQKQPFTALYAFNDDMAIGAIRALHEAGIKVPEQVSVIGIDNEPFASFVIPSLTTVELPIKEITNAAMKIALDLANGVEISVTETTFRGKIIKRESTTPPH
jgi:DNA-binding LacI/PurR family transcriptional regulator